MVAVAPGSVLAGKYHLVRQLGQGGMGSVWQAQHLTLNSPVAIKLIDPSIAENPEALQRFLREAQAAASLRSPHVVQILDHGVDAGTPYIAMELLEGESLANRLSRVGRLTALDTARIMTQVSRAMHRAHEAGIVHRDLKPDNIYLVHNDDEEIAKVLDFGIAKATAHGLSGSAGSGTRTGAMLGTPYYMSPEQAEGIKTLDHRTDIWALGVIAFECLVGKRPFDGETLGGLVLAICTRPLPVPSRHAVVPAGFDEWFARACARDVGERFPDVKSATAMLKAICESPSSLSAGTALASGVPLALASTEVATSSFVNSGGPFSATGQPQTTTRGSAAVLFAAMAFLAVVALLGYWGWQKFAPARAEEAALPSAPAAVAPATTIAPPATAVAEPEAASVAPAAEAPSSSAVPSAKTLPALKAQPKTRTPTPPPAPRKPSAPPAPAAPSKRAIDLGI